MSHLDQSPSHNTVESSLLEGLFQMATRGETESSEFHQISEEIYNRLFQSYAA